MKIVNKMMKKAGSPKKGQRPIAVLIGGGSASGKTTMRETIIVKELAAIGIRTTAVDPDDIKEYIPEYERLKKYDPENAARLVHKESCDIAALLLKQLITSRKHLIYEGTMAKTKKYEKLVTTLKRSGYAVHVYVVDIPLELAKQRADERTKITGRRIPHEVVETTHRLVPKTFECIKNLVDSYRLYDNQNGLTLIAGNRFVDPVPYAKFLEKGGIKYRLPSKNLGSKRGSELLPERVFATGKLLLKNQHKGKHGTSI